MLVSMITEHALLPIKPGFEDDFMAAFERARPLVSSASGFPGLLALQLRRSIETPHHFLLLVSRESAQAPTEGFRGSMNYESRKNDLRHGYDPFPVVEHFGPIEPAATAH